MIICDIDFRLGHQAFGGGGGTSGEVSFPAYIETMHEDWMYGAGPSALSLTVEDAMDVAFANDPYAAAAYASPSADIAVVQTDYDTYYSAVSVMDAETDFASHIDQAVAKADECDIHNAIDVRTVLNRAIESATTSIEEAAAAAKAIVDNDVIQALVDSYESEQSRTREVRVGRYMAGMAELNAMRSSAFLTGLAAIYAQEQEDTDRFQNQINARLFEAGLQAWVANFARAHQTDLQINITNKEWRERKVISGLQVMDGMLARRTQFLSDTVRAQMEVKRLKIVATREYDEAELELDVRSATWDLDMFGKGAAILGSMSGYAHPLPEGPSRVAKVLGGALGGAAAGGAIGGPVGAAIGAGIGGLLGAFS